MNSVDPITLEIVNNRLRYISKEMVITLTRIAYSAVIYDGHDCSAGLFDDKGQLLTLDAGLPFHIASMPFSVKAVLNEFQNDIHPGDIFITNDPIYGGTHLPDILIIVPIFYEGNVAFFAAARGHWTDVGGSTPGSLSGKATEVIQEGLVIPPIKIFERGKLNQRLLELLLSNMRMREIRQGDMMSQIAACRHAERSCLELVEKYGIETIERCGEELINRSEQNLRRKLKDIPEGTYYYEDYMDNDGITKEARRIKVAVTVKDASIFVDFAGSSSQSRGPINCPLYAAQSAVVVAMKILIDPLGAPNEGIFRLIKVNAPRGTLVNPAREAAIGGQGEVKYRIIYSIIGALAKVMPEHISGCDYGSVNHTYISGIDGTTGTFFIHYEYPPGGNGGTFMMDGPSGMRGPSSGNVFLQSNELIESLYPLRVSYGTLRANSGGPGKFRGGLGVMRRVEILPKGASLSIVTDRSVIPSFGVYRGQSGLGQRWSIIRNGVEKVLPFSGKASNFKLKKGDIVNCLSAGGGGFGDPLDRDPESVRVDVIQGYVSMESAKKVYGVVLSGKDLSVNKKATRDQRKNIRDRKRFFILGSYGATLFMGGVKVVMLNKKGAATFRFGDLVEVSHEECPVPYRAKVIFRSKVKPKHALVDDETMQMMGIKDGVTVKLINLSLQQQIRWG